MSQNEKSKDVPDYEAIIRGDAALTLAARVGQVVGVLLFGLGVLRAIDALKNGESGVVGMMGIVGGLACVGLSIVMKMLGSVALAVRDIARNSFDSK